MKRYLILASLWFAVAIGIIYFLVGALRCDAGGPQCFGMSSTSLVREEYFSVEEIDRIEAKLYFYDVRIFPTDDDRFRVRVYDYKKTKHGTVQVNVSDKTLHLVSERKQPRAVFFIGIQTGSPSIEIEVPKNAVKRLNEKSDPLHLCAISVESSSFDISLENIVVGNVDIATKSGDIRLHDCTVKNNFACVTTSGDIRGTASFNNFTITTRSGDCRLDLISEPIGESSFESSSGDFRVRLPESISGFTVHFHSHSGDYRNRFTGVSAEKNTDDRYKDGGATINIKTSSGDCTIGKMDVLTF